MKATYHVNDKIDIEVEGEDTQEVYEGLASAIEVFSTINETCTLCKKAGKPGNRLRPITRTVDKSKYHEIKCLDCGGVLAIGVNEKGGGMYPKRKLVKATGLPATVDEKGPNELFDYDMKGWHKYDKAKVEANKGKK